MTSSNTGLVQPRNCSEAESGQKAGSIRGLEFGQDEIGLGKEGNAVPWLSYPFNGSLHCDDFRNDHLPELPGIAGVTDCRQHLGCNTSDSIRLFENSVGDELAECYKAADHYQDVLRIVGGDYVKHTYWVESEPGLGLTLKTPSKYLSAMDALPRRETELVVAKLSSKVGQSGGMQSTGRVQVGDVVTGISINNEEMQYLAVGPKKTQRERATQVFSLLKQARGHSRLQVECVKEEEEDENQIQWKQFQRPFVQSWFESTRTLIKRQIKVTKRLQALIKLRLFQAMILGLFGGTLFYMLGGKYDQQKMNSVRALGFVSTMSIMLINLVQLPLYMLQRPIFYKHRAQKFFRPSSYLVAHCIVNVPQTLAEAFAYTISVYFLAGLSLAGNGMPFFKYLLLLFMVAYFGSSAFFFLSTVSSIPEVGNALAGLLVSIFLLFSGFVIYPSNVPTALKWLVYVNPIHWANVSFCKIQFENYLDPCSKYESELPFCSRYPHMTVGKAYVTFFELSKDTERPWMPYVIISAWILLANSLALLGLKMIQFAGVNQSLPSSTASPIISKYREDTESEYNSFQSLSDHARHLRITPYTGQRSCGMIKDTSGVERWIQEFRVELEKNELGIPVKPLSIVFEDLSFRRHTKDAEENAPEFRDITGYARPKDKLALLGGAKTIKSTLLKCLAGREPLAGTLEGNLLANGAKVGTGYARRIGYVERLDAHQPYLTIRETLQFSAALRLDQSITAESRHIHVELVLDQLDLLPYSNQLVGSLRDATGKTYEIAKKITIAVELASNPSVLLLEEPLAGLDSRGTQEILSILSRVSESGRVVIASLEYPNTRVLESFDLALILTHDGRQAYFGSVGPDCNEILDYFLSIPKAPRYSKRAGPVSFVLATLGLGVKKRAIPTHNFPEIYNGSTLQEANSREISRIKVLHSDRRSAGSSSIYSASYSLQASVVLMRTQRLLWRNVQYTYGRLTGCIMIGLLMGSLYYKIEFTDVYGLTSRSLYIYMQVILVGVISANNIIPQLGTDRLVYFREKRAGMYLPIFYPISWAVGEIPYLFMATLAVVGIGNGMAGIGTGSAHEFLTYWMVLFVFTLCVTYFGMMITFLAPVPTLAAFAVSILTSFWVSASGVVVLLSDIRFYKWMYWSNPFQYALSLMTSISFYCDSSKADNRCPRLTDGSYVWERLSAVRSLSYDRRGTDTAILSSLCLLFATLAFLFFVVLKHNSPPQI
ncbi:hypothetical protein MLD38_012093 [Melastoma candidum]|uniref:Uncharacterized protein n=1 Tax=Melastoma candidum TaxID=119954 RepID=A0ACB9R587_9MYRT|nr:hypothetical protein MLD38_012093 [Melastoma candidum]